MRKYLLLLLSAASVLSPCAVAAKPGPAAAAAPPHRPAPAFNAAAPRQVGDRVRSTALPYKAIPSGLRESAKPALMARQIYKLNGKNRVAIATPKSVMQVDVHASRPNGFAHKEKGQKVRIPHVRYDPRVIDGRQVGRPSATTKASIPELRTARRFLQSQARQEVVRAAKSRAPARPPMEIAARTRGRR